MKKLLSYSLIGLILMAIIGSLILYFHYNSSLSNRSKAQYSVIISPGDNITNISFKLSGQNIISSPLSFIIYSFTHPGREKILPGVHTIPINSTIPEIFNYLQTDPNREIILTFPEGLTNQEIISKITDNFSLTVEEIENELTINKIKDNLSFIPEENNFEGFLFPDTYRFAAKSDPSDILQRFLTNFDTRWNEATKIINTQIELEDYELLILASIIEKESNSDFEEKQIISGILQKRLAEGIPLGANSTLNYVLSDKKRVFSDFEINYPSQYNTYQNQGLPPTPICNPGLDSLKAAFNPQDTEYYYFLHTPSGETKYAKTYDEHLKNIDKYL